MSIVLLAIELLTSERLTCFEEKVNLPFCRRHSLFGTVAVGLERLAGVMVLRIGTVGFGVSSEQHLGVLSSIDAVDTDATRFDRWALPYAD